jgi:exopolyphosphatase/guanosine-5'-triphosphate,3'-diphosphate pyrophosphatase
MSNENFVSPQSRALVTARQLDRARILGAAMRVAYNISAAMPGVLPRAPMTCAKGRVILSLPADLAPLSGERLLSRMRLFARLIGGEPEIRASD